MEQTLVSYEHKAYDCTASPRVRSASSRQFDTRIFFAADGFYFLFRLAGVPIRENNTVVFRFLRTASD